MSGLTSMHYAENLEDLVSNKSNLGHYANPSVKPSRKKGRGMYEADRGWDELFTDYLAKREEREKMAAQAAEKENQIRSTTIKRAGATVVEITSITQRQHREGGKSPEKQPPR